MAGRCGCSSVNATGASLSAGSCTTITGAGTTESPAIVGVVVDPDASNNLQCGPNGLFAATAQVVAGDDSISVGGDGSLATPWSITTVLSAEDDQVLELAADGLYVPSTKLEAEDASVVVNGDGSTADPYTVGVQISAEDGNAIGLELDGLFAQTAFVEADDGISVTGDGGEASPYVVGVDLDPDASNLLSTSGDGLMATPNPEIVQINGSIFGGAPALDDLREVIGFASGLTDGSGFFTVTFAPFANGIVANILVQLLSLPVGAVLGEYGVDSSTVTNGTFKIRCIRPDGTGINGGAFNFCYRVVGS